jgi:hypothetical protein
MFNIYFLNPLWVSTIAATIAAVAAVLYVVFTLKLILEMREDRRNAYRPIITGFLVDGDQPGETKFVLDNLGKGPALNVTIGCADGEHFDWAIKEGNMFTGYIGVSDPLDFVVRYENKDKQLSEDSQLIVFYDDILGNHYKEVIRTHVTKWKRKS